MGITFIVSAYDRPQFLLCCISSLKCQSIRADKIIIADNFDWKDTVNRSLQLAMELEVEYENPKAIECYWSGEQIGLSQENADWLCFPSDDSYYVPLFSEIMLDYAEKRGLDFVYCDCLYDPRRTGKYDVMYVEPRVCSIDKTCLLVKRKVFTGFPGKPPRNESSAADGLLAESLVARGLRHGKAPGILVVHN